MRTNIKNKIKAMAGVAAVLTWCGTTGSAGPLYSPFLQVDIDGAIGMTQTNFQSWPIPAQTNTTFGLSVTTDFDSSTWLYPAAPGPVTVTIVATNSENGVTATNFPPWVSNYSPDAINRNSMSGQTYANLLNDFLVVMHDTAVGFGGDYIAITFSNLYPNTNYEITVWTYDPSDTLISDHTAWGIVNPNPYGTNSFQPGSDSIPKLVKVQRGGPSPGTNLYQYSGSFIVTTDPTGSATVYGWEDDDSYGQSEEMLLNGFAIGLVTNIPPPPPITNALPYILNPVPASLGSPTVWPYFAGLNIPASGYTDMAFPGTNLLGETFIPTRDMMLRNFYITCRNSGGFGTNTGKYTFVLYDLGITNMAAANFFFVTNNPTPTNLLSPYWSFAPTNDNLTNITIVKFKLPYRGNEVLLSNGHSYLLAMQYVPNSGSNSLVWEGTSTGLTYANGAAFAGYPFGQYVKMTNAQRNLSMAVDVENPNPAITVTSYPLTASTTTWPNLPGMANDGEPVFDVDVGGAANGYPHNPGYLDFHAPPGSAAYETVGTGEGNCCQSMSFYNANTFNLGAVAVVMHGVGSSNCLFTLNVYQITNTFFTAADTIEHWPRNFRPSTDSNPLGFPIWGSNVDFYYSTNLNGGGNGTTDQILVLTLPPPYRVPISGTNVFPYKSYVVELCADEVGENASAVGLFMVERDTYDSGWQANLFPNIGGGTGYRTNLSTNGWFNIEPEMLHRAYPDPEQLAGGVVGTGLPRQMVMAVYAVGGLLPPILTFTSVTHSGNSTALNWTASGGSGTYYFSVWRTGDLSTPRASWTEVASGLSAATTIYTDTTAVGTVNFYCIEATLSP